MTQAPSRPALARKVTTRTEAKRNAELDQGIALTVEGETYTVRVGEITAHVARQFRKATGSSVQRAMDELAVDPDIDSIAALVWLARIMAGEDVALEEVEVGYAAFLNDEIEIAPTGPEVVDGDPEA